MSKNIESIEGIGPAYGQKLRAAGVGSLEELLQLGSKRARRAELARDCEISEALILRWVNMADLCRIRGIGGQYAELLEAAGVDTVKELRNRNAENLTVKLRELNGEKGLTGNTPSLTQVRDWIEQASRLSPVVEY